jgi:hypothetical protein
MLSGWRGLTCHFVRLARVTLWRLSEQRTSGHGAGNSGCRTSYSSARARSISQSIAGLFELRLMSLVFFAA